MLRRVCKKTGCSRLTDGNSKYCSLHRYLEAEDNLKRQQYFASATSDYQTLYASAKWKALQQSQLRNYPQCEKCGEKATEVHHVIPHRGNEALFYDPSNLVSLCHTCHCEETRKEVLQRQKERNEEYYRRKRIGQLWY